jgi:hypothetical protein
MRLAAASAFSRSPAKGLSAASFNSPWKRFLSDSEKDVGIPASSLRGGRLLSP